MKLLRNLLAGSAIALLMAGGANAGIVNIVGLDLREDAARGVTGATLDSLSGTGTAQLDYNVTIPGLDLDEDGSANDSVSFTVRGVPLAPSSTVRAFAQGTDNGFGNLNTTFSVVNVVGTTTDAGDTVVFDGFNGGSIGGGNGSGQEIVGTATINGIAASVSTPADATAGFRFVEDFVDFAAPATTVTFDDAPGGAGSLVARTFDLQFSTVPAATIPEPGSLALLGLAGLGIISRRRR